jgi:L-malate glycosyltransferase
MNPYGQRYGTGHLVNSMISSSPRNLSREHQEGCSTTEKLQRVLFIIDLDPSKKLGSLEEQIFFLASAFNERNSIFLPVFSSPPDERVDTQYHARRLPVEYLDLKYFHPAAFIRLLHLIQANRIEVIHWNFYNPMNLYFLLLTILMPSVPHYITDHTSRVLPIKRPGGLVKTATKHIIFKRYKKVLCVSNFVRNCLAEHGGWAELANWQHLINTERFRPSLRARWRLRRQFGVHGQFVLLVVAHLIAEKGVDVVVRALNELPRHVVLWVIGEGEELGRLQKLSHELLLTNRIRFLGLQRNVENYMQAADCFVCPSVWAEAAGLVNLEALGCGLPVVASATGGIPEFVEDGRTGFLYPVGDYKELAERIRRLVDAPELGSEMGMQARMTAVERFSIQRRLSELLTLYSAENGTGSVC